ncbi:MAG: hypothetical protein RLZZ511_1610 [Cyanobacteriota bacterium]|jgi:PST family polysaccharide transporter
MQIDFQQLIRLKRSEGLRKIIANTGWLFADKILRMGVGLFVGVWVARYLGVERFGLFSYVTAFTALFATLATLGLPSLVIRTITHEPEKREEILGTTFWLQLFGGIAALILSVGTMFVLRHEDRLMLSLVAILSSVPIVRAFGTVDLWFQAQLQSKYTVLAQNVAFLVTAIVKVVLINIQAPLLAFAGAILAEVVFGTVGLIFFYRLQGYSIRLWRWSWPLAMRLLRESYPLILSGFAIIIYMKIDQIMIREMLGDQAVGLYSAATQISEAWYFIPTIIASSFAPTIYEAKKVDKNTYYCMLKRLIKILCLISVSISLPLSFLSKPLVEIVFGNNFSGAGIILAVHIWASVFVFVGVASSFWFIAEGLTYLSFQRTLAGAVSNVLLNLILIPAYGGLGAAVSTVISYAIAVFASNIFDARTRELFKIQVSSMLLFSKP